MIHVKPFPKRKCDTEKEVVHKEGMIYSHCMGMGSGLVQGPTRKYSIRVFPILVLKLDEFI